MTKPPSVHEEKLLRRFHHMCTKSGAFGEDMSEAGLLAKLVGNTREEKMHSAAMILSLVSEHYWKRVGL
jgi:hypothetical protein